MKPLLIVMSAFGPYAKRVEVPLRDLCESGIFLVTGDTGAGKTTIFDAIAFALFGEASGITRKSEMLRSDFADADTKTFVELTFSHRGKIYHIYRCPSYERRKKRGDGFVTEPTDATITLPDGHVISGCRDVNPKITELLGINYLQFKQIVMIAQGEFLKLLLAETKERAEIFRRVFQTNVYLRTQEILKAMAKDSKQSCDESDRSMLQYITGIRYPDTEAYHHLGELIAGHSVYSAPEIVELLYELIKVDQEESQYITRQKVQLEDKQKMLIARTTRAQATNVAFTNLSAANERQKDLTSRVLEMEDRQKELDSAELALISVKPLELDFLREKKEKDGLDESLLKRNKECTALQNLEVMFKTALSEEQKKEPERENLASRIDQLTRSLPQYEELELLTISINTMEVELTTVGQEVDFLKQSIDHGIEHKTKMTDDLAKLSGVEIRLAECIHQLDIHSKRILRLSSLSKQIKEQIGLEEKLLTQKDDFFEAQTKYEKIHATFLMKEAAFFREQAGILAQTLVEGEACPVCGSSKHPDIASLAPDAPSESELQEYRKKSELAHLELQTSSEAASGTNAQILALDKRMRQSAADILETEALQKNLHDLCISVEEENQTCLEESRKLNQEKIDLSATIDEAKSLTTNLEAVGKIILDNQKLLSEKTERNHVVDREMAGQKGRLTTLQKALGFSSRAEAQTVLADMSKNLSSLKLLLKNADDAWHKAVSDAQSCRDACRDLEVRDAIAVQKVKNTYIEYINKLSSCGFIDEEKYHIALRDDAQIVMIRGILTQYAVDRKQTEADIVRLTEETRGKAPEDLEKLESENTDLETIISGKSDNIQKISNRLSFNQGIQKSLLPAQSLRQKNTERFTLLSELSKTANGDLSGKLKIAFEQYVQASYFHQILTEANKRLLLMTNSRYELMRREDASDLRSQTGLELDVFDHYTGKARTVKSLSGGESFKASLSLALGLSDVIQSHAGGIEVDTLFVDEGFGALDSESIEQAIKTLVSLASNDRLVGIISHVAELKDRIEKQVVIRKTPVGSMVELVK